MRYREVCMSESTRDLTPRTDREYEEAIDRRIEEIKRLREQFAEDGREVQRLQAETRAELDQLMKELQAERETAYLLESETMRRRLLEAKDREGGITLEETCERLGI
jgi:DNA repair exonuclease SbcCD ATPase subunit